MSHNVFANNNEVSGKASSGKTICNMPDVCFTPPLTPATPPGVPIPYPNTGMASDTSEGSSSVKMGDQEVMLKNKSCFSKSSGDEAGSAPKKGVVTSKNMGKVYFNAWSMDVKVEGENVPRNLDITTNNHMSKMPGNTPPMPHISSMAMSMGGAPKCEACAAAARAGNPVNPLRGTKLLDGPDDLDFVLEGPLDLVWQRVYMSHLTRVGFFGQGWITPIEAHLVVDAQRVEYIDREGRSIPFPPMAAGDAYFQRQEMCTLTRTSNDAYRLDQADGLSLEFAAPFASADPQQRVLRLTGLVDRNDNRVAIHWDSSTRLRRIDGNGDHALTFDWRDDRLASVVRVARDGASPTAACEIARYDYDHHGDLISVSTRGGRAAREFTWKNHIMVRHALPGGLACFYEWTQHAPDGKVLRSWTNLGSELRFDYRQGYTHVTDQDGARQTFIADADGHWVGYVDHEGRSHRRVLDTDGHMIGTVAPSGAATKRELDERGLPVRAWDATGHVKTTEWHPTLGLPVAETDAMGHTDSFAYDERGNLLVQTAPDGSQTTYEYDPRGLMVAMTDPLGKRKSFEYDSAARLVQSVDCTGSRERYVYDEHGQPIVLIDALDRETHCTYSDSGDLVAVVTPDGAITRYDHDPLGRLIAQTEPGGGRTLVELRADGLVSTLTDAQGRVERYERDSIGRLLRIENANGGVYTIGYDLSGRITAMQTFEGVVHAFGYSDDGELAWSQERGRDGTVLRTDYSYDAAGRPTRVAVSDGEWVELAYDAAGQLVKGKNRHAVVQLEYDELGRCVGEETRHIDSTGTLLRPPLKATSSYDANGNVISTRVGSIAEIGFVHYGSGHLHQIAIDAQPYCDIERDATHEPISMTQQALVSNWRYDDAAQPIAVETRPAAAAGAPSIMSRYAYDTNGDLLGIERQAPWGAERAEFGYDADRCTIAQKGTHIAARVFRWDGAQNPVDVAGDRVQDNMVRSYAGLVAGYDEFGRMAERRASDEHARFEWNGLHQLVGVQANRHGVASSEQYAYDAFGRRIAKITNGVQTTFLWDGERLLMEEDCERRRMFIYHDESQEPIGFVEQPANAQGSEGRRFAYLHDDPNGAPFALTDEEGAVLWQAHYDGLGAARSADAQAAPEPGLNTQPLRQQGQYLDATTGLCYNRFRYFDPLIGRFISPDPIGLLGGENFYGYAPNPFSWTDPLGLKLKNKIDGEKRHKAAVKKIEATLPAGAKIQEECPLRSCKTGKVMKDTQKTGPGEKKYRSRRLDIVVIQKGAVLKAIEVTSLTANKTDQIAKERRIRKRGGKCIKDRDTGDLIEVPKISTVMRLK